MLITLTACETLQKKSTSEEFTIAGSSDQEGQDPVIGSTACDPDKKVSIQVAVSGGALGNRFTVNAFCGGVFLGSSTAIDPGTGRSGTKTVTKPQVAGLGSCSPLIAPASPTWSYICSFNN